MKEKKIIKYNNNKGITLIALVVTIIILLILAGVTISSISGENGIVRKSKKASEEYKKAEYNERIQLIGFGIQTDKIKEEWDNQKCMEEYAKEIRIDKLFKEAKEVSNPFLDNNSNKINIRVITKEGWIFVVTEDSVSGANKIEQNTKKVTELKVGDYVIYITPSGEEIECVVLYDAQSEFGLQVVAAQSVREVVLGSVPENITWGWDYQPINFGDQFSSLADEFRNEVLSKKARILGSYPSFRRSSWRLSLAMD